MKYIGLRLSDIGDSGFYKHISILLYVKDGLDGRYREAGSIQMQGDNNDSRWYSWHYNLEHSDAMGVSNLSFVVDTINEINSEDYKARSNTELLDYLSSQNRFKIVMYDDRIDELVEIDNLLEQQYKRYVARDSKGSAMAGVVCKSYADARKKINKKIKGWLEDGSYYRKKEDLENWLESEVNKPEQLNNYVDFEKVKKIKELGLGDYLDSLL